MRGIEFKWIKTLEGKIDEYIENHKDTTAGLATIVIQDNEIIFNRITQEYSSSVSIYVKYS